MRRNRMIGATDKAVRAVLVDRRSVDREVLAISQLQGRVVPADLAVPVVGQVVGRAAAVLADASRVVAVVFPAVAVVDLAQAARTAAAPLEMPGGAAGSTTAISR